MKKIILSSFVLAFSVICLLDASQNSKHRLDKLKYNRNYQELRGAWIATVSNIDWPIRNGSQKEQEDLLILYLDRLVENNMNSVFFQVKPSGGTIYPSNYAPFAEEFTGTELVENPYDIDFLEFFIYEAHKRNIEVHAWVNPFRIATHTDRNRLSLNNFGIIYEALNSEGWLGEKKLANNRLINYGGRLYLNPGHHVSQDYVLNILRELVEKYDVDGVHFDDYFYQYEDDGQEWLDVQTCMTSKLGKKYNCHSEKGSPRKRGLGHWRRENTNRLVKRIQKEIKAIKPYVKWGVSPFGVWRNAREGGVLPRDSGGSDTLAGSTSYDSLSADTRLWYRSRSRYIDYIIPQIYWTRNHRLVNYESLVDWWVREGLRKTTKATLYVGHALYKAGRTGNSDSQSWQQSDALVRQVLYNRLGKKAEIVSGSVFFSMHHLFKYGPYHTNRMGATMFQELKERLYLQPSIVPPLKSRKNRKAPPILQSLVASTLYDEAGLQVKLSWYDPCDWKVDRYGHLNANSSRYYVVYRFGAGGDIEIMGKVQRKPHERYIEFIDSKNIVPGYMEYGVTSLDRLNNESSVKLVRLYVTDLDG